MKALIIEDEKLAANRLERLIQSNFPDIVVLEKLETVRKSVEWLQLNEKPELIFLDIQLADGLSFEIFKRVKIEIPIIFTTSYDQYALKAFQLNSVDYLLKPIKEEDLKRSIEKYLNLKSSFSEQTVLDETKINQLLQALNHPNYKERFVIKIGGHIKTVQTENILYFKSEAKATFIRTKDQKNYILDQSLDILMDILNPMQFFRINRKYIISLHSFDDIISWSNSRLRVSLKGENNLDAVVAREKVNDFKKWLEGER